MGEARWQNIVVQYVPLVAANILHVGRRKELQGYVNVHFSNEADEMKMQLTVCGDWRIWRSAEGRRGVSRGDTIQQLICYVRCDGAVLKALCVHECWNAIRSKMSR